MHIVVGTLALILGIAGLVVRQTLLPQLSLPPVNMEGKEAEEARGRAIQRDVWRNFLLISCPLFGFAGLMLAAS